MSLHFHNLKLTLNKKKGKSETQQTRYAKIVEHITAMLRGNRDNVKNIKLQDTDKTIELVGSEEGGGNPSNTGSEPK